MEDLPQIGSGWSQDFVKGITHLDGELTIVLDLERVFTSANTVMNVDTERETA
jgi:chemotaxis signal transduction protein